MDSFNQPDASVAKCGSLQPFLLPGATNPSPAMQTPSLYSVQERSAPLLDASPKTSGMASSDMAGYRARAAMPGMYDFVIVIGPGHNSDHIRKIEEHFRTEGLNLLLVGNGHSTVSKKDFLQKAQGKIHPHAPIAFCFHSNVIDDKLYLQVNPEDGEELGLALCADVLEWSSEIAVPANHADATGGHLTGPGAFAASRPATAPWDGTRHLLGCFSGAAAHSIGSMPVCKGRSDKGAVIQHCSWKQGTTLEQSIRRLLVLGTQCAKNMRENRSAGAYRQFAEIAQVSPNTTTLSFPGDPEKLRVRFAKTEDAIRGASLQQAFSSLQAELADRHGDPEAMAVFSQCSSQALDAATAKQRRLDGWFLLAMRKANQPGETHVQTMKAMFKADPSILHAADRSGIDALIYATQAGNAMLLSDLFSGVTQEQQKEISAALNAPQRNSLTPLYVAAALGHADVVKVLLEHGARLDTFFHKGRNALMIASKCGHRESIEVMNTTDPDGVRAVIDTKDGNGDTALHLAIKNKHEELALRLIEMGASWIVADEDGRNAIMPAVNFGLNRLFQVISLKNDAEVRAAINNKDHAGETLLHLAINHSPLEIVQRLIEMGASWTVLDHKGRNAVMLAAIVGREDVFEIVQQTDADAMRLKLDMKSKGGNTALHLAIKHGHSGMARRLIEAGASCTVTDGNWRNAIMLSIASTRNDIFEVLCHLRADDVRATLDNKDKISDTALHLAMKNGHVEIARKLIDWGASCSGLDRQGCDVTMIAVASGRNDLLAILVDSNPADVQASLGKKDYDRNTLLHLAIMNGHAGMVKWLLEVGASCSVKDKNGRNAVMLAIVGGRDDILGVLRQANRADILASLNDEDKEGNTALHLAIRNGHAGMVDWLIRQGASCAMENRTGQNVLMLAVVCGRLDILGVLSRTNHTAILATLNVRDKEGNTALHLAIRNGHAGMVDWLVRHGASCTMADGDGQNAVMLAVVCGQEDMLKHLGPVNSTAVQAAANAQDNLGNTALHLAIWHGDVGMVDWLIRSGASWSVKNKNGENPVMLAIGRGKNDILDMMIRTNADGLRACLDDTDRHGNTMLHLAINKGMAAVARRLIALGASCTAVNDSGTNAIMAAATARDGLEILEAMASAYPGKLRAAINNKDRHGDTAQALARKWIVNKEAKRNVADWLIRHGASYPETAVQSGPVPNA